VVQQTCACSLRCSGRAIDPRERRFVEKNGTTKTEQDTHVNCSPEQTAKGTVHQNTPDEHGPPSDHMRIAKSILQRSPGPVP
jgi:hypothetical protein